MRSYSFFLLLFSFFFLSAQTDLRQVKLKVIFGEEELILNKNYYSEVLQDSLMFKKLQFYISNLQFISAKNDPVIYSEKYILVNLENPRSLIFDEATFRDIDSLTFNLGIDSLTNVSGALGGDLDPTKGMYWSWQSGYINFKLEGRSPVCNSRKNRFQYHLGGYHYPFKNIQKLRFLVEDAEEIILELQLDSFINQVDLMNNNSVMSPSKEAVVLSKLIATSFRIKK